MSNRQIVSAGCCEACAGTDIEEWCTPSEHTASAVRLAKALAGSLAGPPEHPENHPEWYIDDAAVICDLVQEGDGWNVEKGCEGALADGDGFFKVNGTELWFDWNAEGVTSPVLGADRRAELEAEAEDEQ